MNTLQKTFQFTLLILSGLALILSLNLVLTNHYSNQNLICIGAFLMPVALSFILSASLLTDKNK